MEKQVNLTNALRYQKPISHHLLGVMKHRTIRLFTIGSDLLLMNLAFAFAYVARYEWQWLYPVLFDEPYSNYLGQQAVLTLLLILTYSQNKVWRRRRGETWIDEMARIVWATAAGIALMMAVTFFFQPSPFSRLLLFWALVFIVAFVGIGRFLRRFVLSIFYERGVLVDRVLVVGAAEAGRGVIRTLLARPDMGYKVVGYLDDGNRENSMGLGRIPHLGNCEELTAVLQQQPNLHTVFIALPGDMHRQILNMLQTCQQFGVRAEVVPDLLQLSLNRVEFNNMAGIPMLSVRDVRISQTGLLLKRTLDLAIIILLSIPTMLVMGLIAALIRLDSPGPIFYSAKRIGKDGIPFQMIKFRSMVVNAERQKAALLDRNEAQGPVFKMKNDPRMTRVGRLLRRLSLDELPQIINVIKGEMSLVGPRPPLPEEVAMYQQWHKQRLAVVGGLTGLWQVSGRSDLTFDESCLLDIYYIENWSLALDIRIMVQTIPHMLFGRGAY
ncbi:MAG: sugar transferase [Chloroflexota bacterium]